MSWSNGFVVRKEKKCSLIAKVGDHGKEIVCMEKKKMICWGPNVIVVERKEMEKVKHERKKISKCVFWCMVTPLGPRSIYT